MNKEPLARSFAPDPSLTTAPGATLRLSQVSKSYGAGALAVDRIDLDVAAHEFIVLVGPSGCGKSTTLRMIAGLEEVSDGVIEIAGAPVNHLGAADRDVAMVFQNYALYPHMTVAQNIGFGLRRRGVSRADAAHAVQEAAQMLELTDLLDRRPAALSGGQRQRVAMGRAIVRRPKLFLFDEPLSNLDARLRISMRTEIKRLHALVPTTTVYVTHDQTEAMTMADRVVVMRGGKIEQIGTPMEIYNTPVSQFVAEFIGAPGMNFTDAEISDGKLRLPGGLVLEGSALAHRGAVVLGLRPEAMMLAGADAPNAVPARLELLEPLGAETLSLWQSDHLGPVWVRLAADHGLRTGEQAHLQIALDQAHYFNPQTGQRLL